MRGDYAALILAGAASTAHADPKAVTGEQLYSRCSKAIPERPTKNYKYADGLDFAYCIGYLRAAGDMLAIWKWAVTWAGT